MESATCYSCFLGNNIKPGWQFSFLFIFLAFILSLSGRSQTAKSYPAFVKGMYTSGHISQHSKNVSHMKRGYTQGFDVLISNFIPVTSKLTDRQQKVYLDLGINFTDYPHDFLGQSIGITLGRSGRIFQIRKLQVYGQYVQGIGFVTNPYSQENNKNNAISTHFGFTAHANLTALYPVYNNWHLSLAMVFNHLSNGAIRKPNLGLNVFSPSIGLAYHVTDKLIPQQFDYYQDSRKCYYHILGGFSTTTPDSYSTDKYPTYSSHIQLEYNFSLHHAFLFSVDYNYNNKPNYPQKVKTEDSGDNEGNYFGISAGANWKYSIIDFNVLTGIYLLKPWHIGSKTYNQVQFKIYALKNKYFLIGIKAHQVSAELFEAGIGIKL